MTAEQELSITNITGDLESVKKFIDLLSTYNKEGCLKNNKHYISLDGLEFSPENLDEIFDKWNKESKIDCYIDTYESEFYAFADLEFFETLIKEVPEINFEGSYSMYGDYYNQYYDCTYKNHKFHAESRFKDECTDQKLYLNDISGEKDMICDLCKHLENLDNYINIDVNKITYLYNNKKIKNYNSALKKWNDQSSLNCELDVNVSVWEAEDFEEVGFFEFLVKKFKNISFIGKFVFSGNAYVFKYIDGEIKKYTEIAYFDEECYDKEF